MRRLRADLGATHSDLYAFEGDQTGAVCFLLTRRGGVCPTAASDVPGVEWGLEGGYPAGARRVPSAVDGVVSDDVVSVSLDVNARVSEISIINNAFFAEVPDLAPDERWSVKLVVCYASGRTRSITIADPRPYG